MAHYGAAVEYALHTLLNLSNVPAGVTPSARDLAEFQRLPTPFMRKQLTQLARAGLVSGAEGVRGGWQLARPPQEISLLEIADAVHEGGPLFECRNIRARCALWDDAHPPAAATSGVCSIHRAMLEAEAAMRRSLAGRSLAQIAEEVQAKSSQAAMASVAAWFTERYATRRPPRATRRKEGPDA
ncbi:MAG: transcriptional regulator [Chloroflexi bacterium]|nr:MAG: transcriptional regulator [Chloroflexota bacterium]